MNYAKFCFFVLTGLFFSPNISAQNQEFPPDVRVNKPLSVVTQEEQQFIGSMTKIDISDELVVSKDETIQGKLNEIEQNEILKIIKEQRLLAYAGTEYTDSVNKTIELNGKAYVKDGQRKFICKTAEALNIVDFRLTNVRCIIVEEQFTFSRAENPDETYRFDNSGIYFFDTDDNVYLGTMTYVRQSTKSISTEFKIVSIDTSALIGKQTILGKVKIAPNPASDIASINVRVLKETQVSIRVYSATGTLVNVIVDNATLHPGAFQEFVNVKELPSGVYTLKVTTNENTISEKLIVKH